MVPSTPARSAEGVVPRLAKALRQVIGRGDRVVGVGGRLVHRVQDRLEGVVPGRSAGAADDQRVGPRGRDRGGLEHGVGPGPAAVALAIAFRQGSSSVTVPIRLGSVVMTSESVWPAARASV